MTLDELKTAALSVEKSYGRNEAIASTARFIQEANPGMGDKDALAAANNLFATIQIEQQGQSGSEIRVEDTTHQILPGAGALPEIKQTFFDKYKWYIIITMIIIGAGGMYWSYSKLKDNEEEEEKEAVKKNRPRKRRK